MSDQTVTSSNDSLTVSFEPARCIHSGQCLRELPQVFDKSRRSWVDISLADPDQIAEVVTGCPSGALRFERLDGGPQERNPSANVAIPCPDGPLLVRGDIRLKLPDQTFVSEKRVALCRCGASKNKPYCDNSHKGVRFKEPGDLRVQAGRSAGPVPSGPGVEIRPTKNGPLLLLGRLKIRTADGRCEEVVSKCPLCRCGYADDMPYCDGMHGRIRFQAG